MTPENSLQIRAGSAANIICMQTAREEIWKMQQQKLRWNSEYTRLYVKSQYSF